MKLSKQENHRNHKYLAWLREQTCVISGNKAQCAHHVRLGTNGGSGIKPSDYFCIPLLNEYHTTGTSALHIIGEETFFKLFALNRNQLFLKYLTDYLRQEHQVAVQLDVEEEVVMALVIDLIEERRSKPKVKIKSDSKAKTAKKVEDKELRKKIKSQSVPAPKVQFKGNDYYEKAKELKREQAKTMRRKIKTQQDLATNEFYQNAKESRKSYEKEMRAKNKKTSTQKVNKKELYQQFKDLNS